jgi:hypothetical protein
VLAKFYKEHPEYFYKGGCDSLTTAQGGSEPYDTFRR